MHRLTHFFAIMGSILISGLSAAQAQEVANNAEFGNWIVRCEAVSTERNRCQLVQMMTRTKDQSLVVRLVAIPAQNGQTLLVAQVPLGAYLPSSPVIGRPDAAEEEQYEMIWQRCMGQVCEAAMVVQPEELAKFKTAQSLLFGYRMDKTQDPIVVQVDVSRLEEGLGAITGAGAN